MSEVDFEKLTQIFAPEVRARFECARKTSQLFVQYTSSEAAFKILDGEAFWLRNTRTMNDKFEIDYGITRLISFFRSEAGRTIWEVFDHAHPGLSDQIKSRYDNWRADLSLNTYVACVSEHKADENETGRLSMWRAYAPNNGVALIIDGTQMLSESDATRAYTFPVFYKTDNELGTFLTDFVSRVAEYSDAFSNWPQDKIADYMQWFLRTYSLALKHPAFREEREWRIVYRPSEYSDGRLQPSSEIIRGVPQIVYNFPLRNIEGLSNVDIPTLVSKILIGPTDNATVIYSAFFDLLRRRGIDNPRERLHVTTIPLRLGQ